MKKVCFVVLHYGDIGITGECVNSILQLKTSAQVNVVIIDNDYQKNETERMKLRKAYESYGNIDTILIQEELGFSKANNIGYEYARDKHHPDFMIVTNNDILFTQSGFIEKLEEISDRTPYHVLSPDVVSSMTGAHQSPIASCARSLKQVNNTIRRNTVALKLFPVLYPFVKWNIDRMKKQAVSSDWEEVQSDIVPCGACMIFSKQFVEKEETLFFPETDFYYEEYILHYQCIRKGYCILYTPAVRVIHGDGVATKKKTGDEKKRLLFLMRNTLQSAKIYRSLLEKNM